MNSHPLRVVFLGTPSCAAAALEVLLNDTSGVLTVVACVTQPPGRSSRSATPVASPVQRMAESRGIPVLAPESARDLDFLHRLRSLSPDVCVTAAYGQILTQDFLQVPPYGVLNIHPSLLPLYRGAAPVQRAIENGDSVTGVTLAKTVRALDAGPIVAQKTWAIHPLIQAPELLQALFIEGSLLLLKHLKDYCAGTLVPVAQQTEHATHAPKLSAQDAHLNPFEHTSLHLHNRVRAMAGWPGALLTLTFAENQNAPRSEPSVQTPSPSPDGVISIKVISTDAHTPTQDPLKSVSYPNLNFQNSQREPHSVPPGLTPPAPGEISFHAGRIYVGCKNGGLLEIQQLQIPGRKVTSAAACLGGPWSRYRNQCLIVKKGG